MDASPENTGQVQETRFKAGQSGNPAGKPKGARNRVTLAVQELLEGEAEAITRKAIDAALAGDMTAIKLCLERWLPARKDAPINLPPLLAINTLDDTPAALKAILDAVAGGEITPSEGDKLAGIIQQLTQSIEAKTLAERISVLEELNNKRSK